MGCRRRVRWCKGKICVRVPQGRLGNKAMAGLPNRENTEQVQRWGRGEGDSARGQHSTLGGHFHPSPEPPNWAIRREHRGAAPWELSRAGGLSRWGAEQGGRD